MNKLELGAKSLLIAGGVNWLSVAVGGPDLVALATRSPKQPAGRFVVPRRRRPNAAARTVYGLVGGAALYSLGRLVAGALTQKSHAGGVAVREAMTSEPQSIPPTMPVNEAARLLQREDVGSVPVVENGHLLGILTDRDIVLRAVAENREPTTVTAGDIASRELVTVGPAEPLDEALRLMARKQVRRLPVVENGRLVGILAQADVARRVPDVETGEVVEQISR